jgi:hypothetical protein
MWLSKLLFNCLLILLLCGISPYAWSSQFVRVQLDYGITIDLPRDWGYVDEKGQHLLKTYVESVSRVSRHPNPTGAGPLIVAKYPDPKTHASVLVSAYPISKSFGDFKDWKNEDLLRQSNRLQKDLEKSYLVQGIRLIEWIGTRKVNYKGIHAIQNRWRRSMQNNPVVLVEQTLIPAKYHMITLTLSYSEQDKMPWGVIMKAIYQSLSF